MDFYAKTNRLSDKDFKEIIGVRRDKAMVIILKKAVESKPKRWRGARKKLLSIEEQLMLTLKYNPKNARCKK